MPTVGERVVRRAAAKPGAADDSEGAAWPYGFDGDAFLRSAPELYNDWKDPGFLAAHDPKQNEHRDFVILGAAGSGLTLHRHWEAWNVVVHGAKRWCVCGVGVGGSAHVCVCCVCVLCVCVCLGGGGGGA